MVRVRANKGFTLIEMLMVIVVFGIVVAIASSSFMRYRHIANFREAVEDFSSDISLYKQRAMSENLHYRIVINKDVPSYLVQKANTDTPKNDAHWDDIGVVKSPKSYSNQVSITSAPTRITFQPRGTISNATVTMQHAGIKRKANIVTHISGRTNVKYSSI